MFIIITKVVIQLHTESKKIVSICARILYLKVIIFIFGPVADAS